MISIKQYGEMLHDIRGKVNAELEENNPQIDSVVISPTEEHLLKKIKDKEGIILCSNFPGCDATIENNDSWNNDNQCIIMLLEKIPSGSRTDTEEIAHYAYMQGLMERVRLILIDGNYDCEYNFTPPKNIRTEWEYNYGGFNGLSIGFDLKDYD